MVLPPYDSKVLKGSVVSCLGVALRRNQYPRSRVELRGLLGPGEICYLNSLHRGLVSKTRLGRMPCTAKRTRRNAVKNYSYSNIIRKRI